jgi:hypothetical protein
MTFVPVDFIVMDMGRNTPSPIIFGRPFFRTASAVIDSKEGNVKLHKNYMEHFPRKNIVVHKHKCPH